MILEEEEELKNLSGEFGKLLFNIYHSKTNKEVYISTDKFNLP